MNRSKLFTVFLIVVIDLMGFGIVLPLLPFYANQFSASPVAIGLLFSVYSLAQLIFSPIWGGLSDRFGRRPIMLMSTAGASIAYLIFAFAPSFVWLFFSRLFAGIMGGNIATAQAYVTDITPPHERAHGMGILGAAFGIGFTVGPALAAACRFPFVIDFLHHIHAPAFLSESPYALAGIIASLMSALSFIFVCFFLSETVHAKEAAESVSGTSVFTSRFWQRVFAKSNGILPYVFAILIFCVFILAFSQSSLYSAFPLFCEQKLHLKDWEVGMQYGFMGLLAVFIQGGLIRPLSRRIAEHKLFLAGSVFLVIGLLSIPWTRSVPQLMVALAVMAIGANLALPTLNSMVSQQAGPNQAGATMGTSQGMAGLGRVLGPTWGGWLFSYSVVYPFVFTACVACFLVIIGVLLVVKHRGQPIRSTS